MVSKEGSSVEASTLNETWLSNVEVTMVSPRIPKNCDTQNGSCPRKCTCELWILIRHNHSWQPMVPQPTFEKRLCGFQRGGGFHNRHHVCQLGKPLYHQQDGIILMWLRQICDQIHAHTMPWPQRDRQRLQGAALLLVRGSVHLALLQSLHKVGFIFLHAPQMVPPWHHSMVAFSLSSMAGNETIIFLQNR